MVCGKCTNTVSKELRVQVAASADNQMDLINGSSVCESRRFGSLQVCPFRCVLPHSGETSAVILEKQLLLPINLWRVIRSFPDSPPSHSEKDSVSMLNVKVAVSCNWPWKRLYFPFLYYEPYCPCKTHFTFKPHLFEFFSPDSHFHKRHTAQPPSHLSGGSSLLRSDQLWPQSLK